MDKEISLYIHIPFCKHRCSYCDFNTYAGLEDLIPSYVRALCAEISMAGAQFGGKARVKTIFIGGGTPSYLPVELLENILNTCDLSFVLMPEAEISFEANPGTLTLESLTRLKQAGFNRISMGMQSAHPVDLTLLERIHDTFDVMRSVHWARIAGFDNLSLDLIFGLPGQPLERWKNSLDVALSLRPQHLSLYALTVEHGTPFRHWVQHGLVSLPDDDLAADMYEWACERLEKAGYRHYEISNWALASDGRDLRCQHNLQYWRNRPYFGFGAGAHGYIQEVRTRNVRGVRVYIQRIEKGQAVKFPPGPAGESDQRLDVWSQMQETLMVGLRLTEEGVNDEDFYHRYGLPLTMCFGEQIQKLQARGLVSWDGTRLRLSRKGWLLGNMVFREFVGLQPPEVVGKRVTKR